MIADGIQVEQDMVLAAFGAIGASASGAISTDEDVTINLRGGRVGGTFWFNPRELRFRPGSAQSLAMTRRTPAKTEHEFDPHRRLAANGLTYSGVPEPMDASIWLDLLRKGTPKYSPQPYEQLAAGYRAVGADRLARFTLKTQRDDELARKRVGTPGWTWGHITKFTVGYGYQPGRALALIAIVVILSSVLAFVLGSHGALAQTDKTAKSGRSCTMIQEISVGMDLGLPIGTSLAREDCDLPRHQGATAAWLITTELGMRSVAWALTALFAAAVTGALPKINL